MRAFVLSLVFLAVANIKVAQASSLGPPECFVKAKVESVGSQKMVLDSGRSYDSEYIDLEIIENEQGGFAPVKKGQVYRATDNNPGALKEGDIIRAGIASSSSMGPWGPVLFLQWQPLTYGNGAPVIGKNGVPIEYLQSDDQPLVRMIEEN